MVSHLRGGLTPPPSLWPLRLPPSTSQSTAPILPSPTPTSLLLHFPAPTAPRPLYPTPHPRPYTPILAHVVEGGCPSLWVLHYGCRRAHRPPSLPLPSLPSTPLYLPPQPPLLLSTAPSPTPAPNQTLDSRLVLLYGQVGLLNSTPIV